MIEKLAPAVSERLPVLARGAAGIARHLVLFIASMKLPATRPGETRNTPARGRPGPCHRFENTPAE